MNATQSISLVERLGGTHHFLSRHWERQWGVFRASFSAEEIARIAPLEAIDRHVMSGGLKSPDLQLISGGRAGDVPMTSSLAPATDSAFLLRAYKNGQSFRIQHLENYLPELAAWCSVVERELGAALRVNAYFSPPGGLGLAPHYDGCDSFVLQIHGEKIWQVFAEYTDQIPLPTPEQRFSPARHRPLGEPTSTILRQGDVLYLPRGVMHSAFTQAASSIHLTVSVLASTWADLLSQIVQIEALQNESLRRLAVLHGGNGEDLQALCRQVQVQLDQLNLPGRLTQALEGMQERVRSHKPRVPMGALLELWRST